MLLSLASLEGSGLYGRGAGLRVWDRSLLTSRVRFPHYDTSLYRDMILP